MNEEVFTNTNDLTGTTDPPIDIGYAPSPYVQNVNPYRRGDVGDNDNSVGDETDHDPAACGRFQIDSTLVGLGGAAVNTADQNSFVPDKVVADTELKIYDPSCAVIQVYVTAENELATLDGEGWCQLVDTTLSIDPCLDSLDSLLYAIGVCNTFEIKSNNILTADMTEHQRRIPAEVYRHIIHLRVDGFLVMADGGNATSETGTRNILRLCRMMPHLATILITRCGKGRRTNGRARNDSKRGFRWIADEWLGPYLRQIRCVVKDPSCSSFAARVFCHVSKHETLLVRRGTGFGPPAEYAEVDIEAEFEKHQGSHGRAG